MLKDHEINILLIDHDAKIGSLARSVCAQEKYALRYSSSWEEGYNASFDINIHVLVIELDGLPEPTRILNKFREKNPFLSVVATGESPAVESVVAVMRHGACDFLVKPFTAPQLSEALLGAVMFQRESVERQHIVEEARQKAYYQRLSIIDDLTEIYNYRYFNDMCDRELARAKRYPQEFSLLMADIDNFKNYNDSYGHLEGDKLLRAMAQFFVKAIRSVDMAFRYGGEEFVILLPQTPKKGAVVTARRIISSFRKEMPVTASMGVATYPEDGSTKEGLLKNADHALYQAKFLGKNKVCVAGSADAVDNQ